MCTATNLPLSSDIKTVSKFEKNIELPLWWHDVLHCQISPSLVQCDALVGQKPKNQPLSNLHTGSCPQGNPVDNNCTHCCRVSGNPGNFLEFFIPSGNTGNILEFRWSSGKCLTARMTTEVSSHKKFSSSPVVWKMVYISRDGYVYLVNRITVLRD